ncbi:MAG: SH3 domain-containing protein [Saprospiraceae bacterium]
MVRAAQTSLRAEPTEKSREIAVLQKGQTLTDLGEVSRTESEIALGGEVVQSPWIKVQTPENQTGWVLAWALRPALESKDWLLQKRLSGYFGEAGASRRNALCRAFPNLETEGQLADAWREANTLRDTFLLLLSHRPQGGFQPQFSWLSELLPGFLFQKMEEGERPQLFADFRVWRQMALKTTGKQDDAFLQTCLAAFPKDSIESFFPAWEFQISDTESASQLGSGQHLKMLRHIGHSLQAAPMFASQLEAFKEQVLEDVFGKNVRYWQPQEKILGELAEILADPPRCLSTREREALGIRQKMFEDPVGNGIRVNLRSGE